MTEVHVVEEELRFKFMYDGRLALAYNKGFTGWGDFRLSRPNFYPVHTPCGRQVTISSAYRYNHHRSIFIGHANVNGTNFFHDNNPTRPNLGDIVLEDAQLEQSDGTARLRTSNGWIPNSGERVLSEQRDITWTPGDRVHVLDVSSTLSPDSGDVTFARENHAYLGVRVADTMDVEDGGKILNSNGQKNEEGTMGQMADWVDYSGEVAGRQVGVTLMRHPDNPPSPYFVRDYGSMLCCFTLDGPFVLKKEETLTQRFRVVVHTGGPDEVDIAGYYASFREA
jgi:hypothetical protein